MTWIKRAVGSLIRGQRWLSGRFDRLLPGWLRIDGNSDFVRNFAPQRLAPDLTVYDVGGGARPAVSLETKRRLGLKIIGMDIDQAQLDQAPAGSYDAALCADVCRFRGTHDADLVICQALLEHVPNVADAIQSIASMLKPGGRALIFVPSRNALFARLNLLLPQRIKQKILFSIFAETRQTQGFPAFYDRCTPRYFRQMAGEAGLSVEEEKTYYSSGYFSFCTPLHVLLRIYQMISGLLWGAQAAETFVMSLRASPISNRQAA